MDCDQAQGFFYARPLKQADLEIFALQSLQKHPVSVSSRTILNHIAPTVLASMA